MRGTEATPPGLTPPSAMKIPRHFALAAALLLTATPASADIIGVEQFDYPDGAIAGSSGGTFWDYKNTSPVGHGGVASTWDNLTSAPQVTAGRLVTSGNGAVKREYRGANETEGAVNDANVAKEVFYRVTVTTGPSVSAADYFGISSMDFGTEKIYFGKRGGSSTWGVEEVGGGGTDGSATIAPNTTYTLVAIVDFANDFIRLYVNPDLNGPQPGPGSAAASRAYTGTNWSTAVRFAAGTAVTWDDLVVATEWEDLGTIVTTAADQDDGGLNPSGGISLREAVKYSPAGTLVTFAPALSGQTCTLTHADGDMLIPSALTLDASTLSGGFTISGNDTHRHFHVESGKSLTLRGLTLTRGNGTGSGGSEGGSIMNHGTLSLQRCDFTGNATSFSGGAVSSSGTLRATDTTMAENAAMVVGGGLMVAGGSAELSRCTLSGNTANDAGAFWQQGTATATLSHCTVAGNRSTGSTTTGGIGAAGGVLTLQHCTVTQNTGRGGGGGFYLQAPATVNLQTSIIAGNSDPGSDRPDIETFGGTLVSSGRNLIGDNTGVETVFPAGTPNGGTTDDYVGSAAAPLDPKLSALGHFGGPVMTMHPLTGSWAIDKAGGTPPAAATDARGFSRFEDGDASESPQLDIGAVEAGTVTFVTTNEDEDNGAGGAGVSLREALALSTTPGRRIRFHPGVFPGTITLGGTELTLPATPGLFIDASNITGAGVTISGNNASRVFSVPVSATAGLHSLKIVEGDLAAGGSGIANQGTLSLMACALSGNSSGFGGAIYNEGPLLVWRSTFSGNTTNNDGGAILNDAGGRLTVVQSSFSGNAANVGGAILNQGRAALTQTTISGNTANTGGGGFFSLGSGSMVLSQSIVAGNTSPAGGRDIHVDGGSVTPSGTNFVGNLANSGLTASATLLTGDARLAPLASNGGPTQTMALRSSSPARNAAGPVNEVQRIPAAGPVVNHRLTFKGQTTALIGTEDSAATFQSALAALSTIGAGNVSVSGSGSTRQIDFIGSLAAADQPQLTSDSPFINSGITTLTQGHPGSSLATDQRGFARFGAADLGAFEAQISSLADVTIKANTATSALPFTVGQVGTLTATSGNTALLPNANIVLGGSGANRTITLTPAANRYGTAEVTLSASTGETLTFTLTVTAFEVTTLADSASPGSLRQALADAAASPGADLILFAPALSGKTITLASEFLISDPDPVTLDATALPGGLTLSGGGNAIRHFQVQSGKSLTLRGLTLTGGNIIGTGGAISNQGTLALTQCSLIGNSAFSDAGALFNLNGTVTLAHCTLAGNSTPSRGGAIYNFGGSMELSHCTLSGNSAGVVSGAILNQGPLTLTDSIVSGNASPEDPDISQAFGSLALGGVNFIGNLAGTDLTSSATLLTGDAKLSPLGYFGGPVQTMHPLIGSPAIDTAGTTDPGGTDARGFPRFVNGEGSGDQLDIGAVEAAPLLPVTTAGDGGGSTLRTMLGLAASPNFPAYRLTFDPTVFPSATITLGGTELSPPAGKAIFIDASNLAAPVTISGNNQSRVFNIPATATVAMHSLRIMGGNNSSGGAQDGGGILNDGTCTVMASTLSGNFASYDGGGIWNNGRCAVVTSTLNGNGASASGGGIFNNGTCTVRSSTFSGNAAYGGGGGGIYNSSSGPCTVLSSTLSGNTTNASDAGGIFNFGTLHLNSSIVAGNLPASGDNISGTVTGSDNLTAGDPLLLPLGNYGGPTQTMPPRPGSPALDLGAASPFLTDQRGLPRNRDGDGNGTATPDIGAVEASLIAVTTVNDNVTGSLRAALTEAAAQPGADTVYFTPAVTSPVTLTSEIVLTDTTGPVLVDASDRPTGVVIDGGPGTNRHFRVTSGTTATFQRLRLTGGGGTGGTGPTANYGGSIHNGGTLTLRECTIADCSSTAAGGAIYSGGAALTIERSTLSNNTAPGGGAIQHESLQLLTLTACTLANNTAGFEAGAINAPFTRPVLLQHCTISGNRVLNAGANGVGGVRGVPGGFVTVRHSIISGNTDANTPGVPDINDGFIPAANNIIGGNARLAPLGDYGGPTLTMALRPGSPARSGATSSTAATDQRGFPPVGLRDLGAYEAGTPVNYDAFIWETLPDTASVPEHAATFDYDGDGQSNGDEYTAGTLVTDPLSVFRIVQTSLGGGIFSVTFPTVPGRTYQLQSSPDLADPWTDVGSAAGGTGGNVTLPVTVTGFSRYFFRVTVIATP